MGVKRYRTESGLPRVRIECATMRAASEIRMRYRDCCAESDDKRSKTVIVSGDILDSWLQDMVAIDEDHKIQDSTGQAELTSYERKKLDFSRTNIFHARSCKAIAIENEVTEWLDYYDVTLTVDEHREVYARTGASSHSNVSLRTIADVIR